MLVVRRALGKTAYFPGPYLSLPPSYHAKERTPFLGYTNMHFTLEVGKSGRFRVVAPFPLRNVNA